MRGWTAIPLSAALMVLGAPAAAATLEGGSDLAEIHLDRDRNIFLDGTLSYGSQRDRAVAKLTADGRIGRLAGAIDGQLLYSRGIGGSFAVLAGIRHEFRPHPHLTYAVLGVEGEPVKGLALESYFFLSEKGDATGEMKAIYDLPLSERWTLQPRAVLDYAVQSVAAQGLASGPTQIELGVRLRYELAGVFAPYIGISHQRLLGGTVKVARAAGDDAKSIHFVIGFSSAF